MDPPSASSLSFSTSFRESLIRKLEMDLTQLYYDEVVD